MRVLWVVGCPKTDVEQIKNGMIIPIYQNDVRKDAGGDDKGSNSGEVNVPPTDCPCVVRETDMRV